MKATLSKTNITEVVKESLEESGFSQKEVSIVTGIHISQVNRWFKGEMTPSGKNLECLIRKGFVSREKMLSLFPRKVKKKP